MPSVVWLGGMRMSMIATSGWYSSTARSSNGALPACARTFTPARPSRAGGAWRNRAPSSARTPRSGMAQLPPGGLVTSLFSPAAGPASPPDRPSGPALAVPDLVAARTGPNPAAIPANPQAPLWRPAGQDSPPPHRNSASRAAGFPHTAQQRPGTADEQKATEAPFQEVT